MAAIRLLADEDVRALLAETLWRSGFDDRHVTELDRGGFSDAEHLAFAVEEQRVVLPTTSATSSFILLGRE